jgi:hypothetical protein
MSAVFQFEEWPKISRYRANVIITEKIDGTNAQVAWFRVESQEQMDSLRSDPHCLTIHPGPESGDSPLALYAGNRSRWLTTDSKGDNFGFAKWVLEHSDELVTLGEGRHFGEWWGQGIQRGYGLTEKRFSLFNVHRWNPDNPNRPACCGVVPIIKVGSADEAMELLHAGGSIAAQGFMNPEGIIVYHSASRTMYKQTFENDGGKWKTAA